MTTPGLILAGLSTDSGQLDIIDEFRRLNPSRRIARFSAGALVPGVHLLDPVMCGVRETVALYAASSRSAEMAVIVGPRGLFDAPQIPGYLSARPATMSDTAPASPAHLAALLGLPVVLVIDVSGMSQTIGAVIKGVTMMDPEVRVQGVFLMGYTTETHRDLCRMAVEAQGVAVIENVADVLELAEHPTGDGVARGECVNKHPGELVVAVTTGALPEWADVLGARGAQVVKFDPLTEPIPACDGVIIDGPVAPRLRDYVAGDRPLYVQGPAAWQVVEELGVQAMPGDYEPGVYREAVAITESAVLSAGHRVVGIATARELLVDSPGWEPIWAWRTEDGRITREGMRRGNITATALCIHPAAGTVAVERFLAACAT